MKRLTFLFIIFASTVNAQTRDYKTEPVEFQKAEYYEFLISLTDSLKKTFKINWIYYRPTIIKTASEQPEVESIHFPTILVHKFGTLTFTQNEIENLEIIEIVDFFDYMQYQDIDTLFEQRKIKYGKGIVVSLPYKWNYLNKEFINFEIIDWDRWGCGQTHYAIEYK